MRAVVLDHPTAGPYALESGPATRRGLTLEILPYETLLHGPLRAELVVNAGDWPLPGALLDRLEDCRCVVSYGVGTDWVDVAEAGARGIVVANTPQANVREVAEHALAMLLACSRRLLDYDRTIRAGGYRPSPLYVHERLEGRTLGLLAFGKIARWLARFAAPLGLRLIAHDPFVPDEAMRELGVEPVEADELLHRSQLLSVHLPATPATRGYLSAERLALLPRGAILVVTSRGAVYDGAAVASALASGRLAGAGLDVFPTEPLPDGDPLRSAPNAILTPHIAGVSEQSELAARESVAAAIEDVLSGRPPASALNPQDWRPLALA